jgi:hypothetical protein
MDDCRENHFCKSLSHDLRERLCKHCIKTTYAKNSVLKVDMNHPWLLLEGIVCATVSKRPMTIITPGDMLLTPRFRPAMPGILAMDDNDFELYYSNTRYECVTPILAATYSTKIMYDLLEDARFARMVLDSTLNIQMQVLAYQSFLYHNSAYEAVRYILKLARAYHIQGLTHAQIAHLSGRNRTTVTKVIHELALGEPDLIAEESQEQALLQQ